MKRKFLSLLLFVCVALGAMIGFSGCGEAEAEKIDYVAQTKLDMNSTSKKLELEPTDAQGRQTYTHIDGDTTHFNVDDEIDDTGIMKARYLGCNTPESTGDIEPWGKKASNFTKTKLASASSIVVEADGTDWEKDTNQRFLLWIWYLPEGATDYRLLNLELIQEGLALLTSVPNSPYEKACTDANLQAQRLKLHVYSNESDPDYFYDEAIITNLKDIHLNMDEYIGKRVAFEGVVTAMESRGSIYIEEFYEAENRSYGLPIYYGLNHPELDPVFKVGNRVYIAGEITKSDTFGYQMSALKMDEMNPDDPENVRLISSGNATKYTTMTVADFVKDDFAMAKDYQFSSVSLEGLYVSDVYTTQSQTDSNGAISLTCRDANGNTITVRTIPLKENGTLVTEDRYDKQTIDVKGIIDTYTSKSGTVYYQVNVFALNDIFIHAA